MLRVVYVVLFAGTSIVILDKSQLLNAFVADEILDDSKRTTPARLVHPLNAVLILVSNVDANVPTLSRAEQFWKALCKFVYVPLRLPTEVNAVLFEQILLAPLAVMSPSVWMFVP